MKQISVPVKPTEPSSAVSETQMMVLHTRNGMRRRARSVIPPRSGEMTKMMAIEMAEMLP